MPNQKYKHFLYTDTSIIARAMEQKLTPLDCRVWQFHNAYNADEVTDFNPEDAANWLGITKNEFIRAIVKLEAKQLLGGSKND